MHRLFFIKTNIYQYSSFINIGSGYRVQYYQVQGIQKKQF